MAKSAHTVTKDAIQMREVKMRFVYVDGVKGEWINGLEAFQNGFMTSHDELIVDRIEFEAEEKPPRIRQTRNG